MVAAELTNAANDSTMFAPVVAAITDPDDPRIAGPQRRARAARGGPTYAAESRS